MEIAVGTEFTSQRTFTKALIDAFTEISQDRGRQHVDPAGGAPVIVHGLLVATLATEIGGRFSYLARTMEFDFIQPVFLGDTITCKLHISRIEGPPERQRMWFEGSCFNQSGAEVMSVKTKGVVIRKT